jgi:predicted ATPase
MIRQLRIENFKAFRDQRISLAPLTLLTGLNGSGKSSVLQALLALRQSFDQGLLNDGRLALDGGLVRLGTFQDALFESATQERIGFELLAGVGQEERCLKWDFGFLSKDDRVSQRISRPIERIDPVLLFGPGFRFLSAERIGPRVNYRIADSELTSVGLGTQGEWTAQYLAANEERAIPLQHCSHPKAVGMRLLSQVEAWMSEFSPGLRIELAADVTRDAVSLRYRFEARRGVSNSFRATNVGFGVSYTLPVVVAILSASPGDLVLLEAPEAHLHPRGQSKLGELVARAVSSGVQVLVETHSDHVMNGVRVAVHQNVLPASSAGFLYFGWDPKVEDGATSISPIVLDEDGRISNWPEGFFDEMDRSIEVLLSEKPR